MKWAVVALNTRSMAQGKVLKDQCGDMADEVDLYTLDKYRDDGFRPIIGGLKAFNETLFAQYEVIIYIMAMGIIVRDIAPWLKHKSMDPAVLCYAVDGRHIIPVLSGHLGGANELAMDIAGATGAQPIITTASDLLGKTAVDMMAKSKGLTMSSFKDAKDLTAMIINGERICLYTDTSMTGPIEGMVLSHSLDKEADGLIYVGYKKQLDWSKPSVRLVPKKLVLGMGCRRGTTYGKLKALIDRVMAEHNIDISAIGKLASIDLKADEEGLIELSDKLKVGFVTYSSQSLQEVERMFEISDFVKKTTGVGAVAMPSGYLGSNKGRCVVEKVAEEGITLCVWEEKE